MGASSPVMAARPSASRGGSAPNSSASPSSSSAPAGAAAIPAATTSFTQMPFTFVFNGNFFDLEHLFGALNRFTVHKASGELQVSGRLLTIQSVHLGPVTTTGTTPSTRLAGTITATAYVLPAKQGLTAGATPTAPAGASASSSSGTGTPAIVRATP